MLIVCVSTVFRGYLYGGKFYVYTDSHSLRLLHQLKQTDFRPCHLRAKLMNFDFEIIYKPGKLNKAENALSKNPVLGEKQIDPDQPKLKLYEMADKSLLEETYDSASEVLLSLFCTNENKKKSAEKRPRFQK